MAYQDLLKDTSQYVENGDYFLLTITDLDINTSYPIQFRWKKKDGSFSVWSGVRTITTPGESTPATPSTLTVNGGSGLLTITWDGKDALGNTMTNLDRLDIYIDGAPFDATKPAASFFVAGTQTVSAPAGTYIVAAYAVSKAGTKSAVNSPVTRTVTSPVPTPASSVTPSTPTVSSVLGAIQLSWNGKTSTGGDQPYGFDAAKVYVGTSSTFTPSSSNQVDTLNFANGQNTLNIGVGTVVNGVALDYGIDYYVKIATTNGTDTSTPVSASGNPVRVGQVTSGDIVTITADKIATGTLSAGSTITVGSPTGKRVTLAGTGDPFAIFDTDGTTKLLSYSTTSGRLSIVGDGSFTGNLSIGSSNSIFKAEPATGIWLGNASYSSAPFSVSTNGVIKANSGTIGGWTLADSYLQGTNFQINSSSSTMFIGPYASGDHIRISASGGIQHTNSSGSATGKFTLTPNGNLSLSGTFTISASSTIDGETASTVKSNSATGATAVQPGNGVSLNPSKQITTISAADGLTITTGGSTARVELTSAGLKAYNNSSSTPTVSINSDGSAIFKGDITGATGTFTGGIKTNTSGARVEIPAADGEINLYTSDSTMDPGNINTLSVNFGDGILNWMALLSPTKSTFGQSNIYLSGGASNTSYIVSNSTKWKHQGRFEVGDVNAVNAFINADGTSRVFSLNTSFIDMVGAEKWIQLSTGGVVRTLFSTNGTIYANYLNGTTDGQGSSTGGTTGTAIVQNSSGYLKVSGSSRRFKEDITPISQEGYLDAMLKIEPVNFRYINPDFEEPLISGLIAEDLDLIPEFKGVVNYDKDELPVSISYDRMSALLVLAIKELKQEFDMLKERLDALEG